MDVNLHIPERLEGEARKDYILRRSLSKATGKAVVKGGRPAYTTLAAREVKHARRVLKRKIGARQVKKIEKLRNRVAAQL